MKSFLFLITISALLSAGCASINSLSLTPIPANRSNKVEVVKSKVIILGFNFDNDFVDQINDDLKAKCPAGKVSGILTKDENINYFLYFVWKKQVSVTGYCVNEVASTRR